MGLPNPSRETQNSQARTGTRNSSFFFPVQLADREQDWQPCPVVMVIHINKLYIHTAVVIHNICIYSSEPCTNVHAPK